MIGKRTTGGVNMLHLPSASYGEIQGQLLDLVAEQLPPHRVTHSVRHPVDGALNLVLHIRMGKQHKQVPSPGQVLMSHGLADKSYFFVRHVETGEPLVNYKQHVLVPGEWHRSRILERRTVKDRSKRIKLTEDQVHVVGWPRLDPLVQAGAAERLPVVDRPLRVLWAPSHDKSRVGPEKRRLSSYPEFEQYLPRLQEEFEVRVSLHPANRTDKTPTQGALEWADVVISDFGTLLYEAWALHKCVILPSWLMPPQITSRLPGTAEAHVYRERIGQHAGSFEELREMVAANEPPGSDVTQFMQGYLAPEYFGTASARAAQVLDALAPNPTAWQHATGVMTGAVRGAARRARTRIRARLRTGAQRQ